MTALLGRLYDDHRNPDATTDEYRVRIWPSYSWWRLGYRVQVDLISDWEQHGDVPLIANQLGIAPWFPTSDQAIAYGIEMAREIHADEVPDLPLVVIVGGEAEIDERTEVTR